MPMSLRMSLAQFLGVGIAALAILARISSIDAALASNIEDVPGRHFLHDYAAKAIEQMSAAHHAEAPERAAKRAPTGHHGARFTAE